ncbi:MAG: uL15 family ribosomal protein [Candidatus Diapherotrites archaeon]|nr:uL15 family ribosomal protein [Candidatus Diapherotrites archaeon]
MVVRRSRKVHKLRGHRVHGHGDTKNRRGSGSHGGMGRSGSHKHKYSSYYATFGVKKTLNPKQGEKQKKTLDLDDVSRLVQEWTDSKTAEKVEGRTLVDGVKLGVHKILGSGSIQVPVHVRNMQVSSKAKKKIILAKGAIEGLKESEAEELAFEAGAEEDNETVNSEADENPEMHAREEGSGE